MQRMKSLLAAMVVAGALVLGANTASAWDGGGWGGCGGCGGCGFGGCGSFSRVRYTNVYRATSLSATNFNLGGWGSGWGGGWY